MALFRGDDVAPSERTAQTCRSSNTLSRRQCNSESSFAGGNLHEAIARRRKYATSTAPGSAAVSHFRSNKATGLRYRSSWSGRQRLSFYYCVMVIGVLLVCSSSLVVSGDDNGDSRSSHNNAHLKGNNDDNGDDDVSSPLLSPSSEDDSSAGLSAHDNDNDGDDDDAAADDGGTSQSDEPRGAGYRSGGLHPSEPSPPPSCRRNVLLDSIVKLQTNTQRSTADQFISIVRNNLLSDNPSSRIEFEYHMAELQAFSLTASECFVAELKRDPLVDFIEDNDVVPLIQALLGSVTMVRGVPHFPLARDFPNHPRLPPFFAHQLKDAGRKRKRRSKQNTRLRSRQDVGDGIIPQQVSQTCQREVNVQAPLARINFRQLSDARDRPIYDYEENAGQGVVAYIVDTGVFGGSTDFAAGNVERGIDTTSDGGDSFQDAIGHGTHVAGIIGSQPFGVAKSAMIVAVKVFNDTDQTTDSSVIAGLNYIFNDVTRRQQPAVINLSLGAQGRGTHRVLNMAVECLIKAGVVVVTAAGNNNEDACQFSPALLPSTITVGNVDSSDRRHANSSFGSCVDIFAPGVNSISTGRLGGSFRLRNGTSVSAAFVTGVVARLLAICPTATPAQIKEFLISSSTKDALFDVRGSPNRLLFIECTDRLRTCEDLGASASSAPAKSVPLLLP